MKGERGREREGAQENWTRNISRGKSLEIFSAVNILRNTSKYILLIYINSLYIVNILKNT